MKIRTKTVHEIDCFELEELIKDIFSNELEDVKNFEIIAAWETGNDSTKTFDITKKLDKYDEEELNCLLNHKKHYGYYLINSYSAPRLFMVELCRRGLIPEGSYNVDICW